MSRDPLKLYDVRTLERNLRKGLVSKKDYEKYLKALPDREANAVTSRPDESRDPEYPVEESAAEVAPGLGARDDDEEGDDLEAPVLADEGDEADDDEEA